MIEFYRKFTKFFSLLALATLVLGLLCALMFFGRDELLPAGKSFIPWQIELVRDHSQGQRSTISVTNQTDQLEFDYLLNPTAENPYVKLVMIFDQALDQNQLVDFSRYYKASFKIRCSSYNVLSFNLRTFDENATEVGKSGTYRFASHWFDCSNHWSEEHVNLERLEVPLWWLLAHNVGVHDRSYRLDQVFAISFDSSKHGLVGEHTQLTLSSITLHYYNWKYLGLFVLICCVLWISFWVWAFKHHSKCLANDIKAKIVHDMPLIAYQKLSIASHKDKEKSAVLDYLGKHYADPNINMDGLIQELGVNRKKVSEILKEEIGFTFKAYLNKLRLTEAARLLCEQPKTSINEIAFSVGYKNVTHFNKLFKDEFGCAPNKFKSLNLSANAFSDDD